MSTQVQAVSAQKPVQSVEFGKQAQSAQHAHDHSSPVYVHTYDANQIPAALKPELQALSSVVSGLVPKDGNGRVVQGTKLYVIG